jgi:hypothetical protein
MCPPDDQVPHATDAKADSVAQPWWKSGKQDLRTKLHAWWEGYRLPAGSGAKVKPASPSAAGPALKSKPATAEQAKSAPPPKDHWSPERILVAQLIWGDGFSFPGGGDFAA